MKIKKGALGAVFLVMVLLFVGCSNETKIEKTPEQKFIEVFEKQINNRWTETDKLDSKNLDEESYKKELIKIFEDEVNALKLAVEPLTDVTLKKIANNYIEGTLVQIKLFETNDSELMWTYEERSNKLRKPALTDLVDTYGVNINKEHEQTYKDFKEAAIVINKENEAKKYAEKLALEMQFKGVEDEYGMMTYETIIENTSDITFTDLSFNIKCKDKDGVVISTESIFLDDFEPATKQRVEIRPYVEGIETLAVTVDNLYLE